MKAKLNETLLLAVILGAASVRAATLYVDAASTNALPPYTNWPTAAAVIQDAVDAAAPGDTVLVTNGVYSSGGRALAAYPLMTNRVCVDRAITLRSVNGPEGTIIQGYQVPGTTNGNGAIRCVYLIDGAVLNGFTLTNGGTRTDDWSDADAELQGGGVWCGSSSAVIFNCLLSGNSASFSGGGARGGTLHNSSLTGNSSLVGGGTYYSTLNNCKLTGNSADGGGGAMYSTLNNCTLTANTAKSIGGGTCESWLNNCVLTGNSALEGGGVWCENIVSTMNNCTVAGNSAQRGGGVVHAILNNCIVYHNTAQDGPNFYAWVGMSHCCTTPQLSGTGNITNEPLFMAWTNGNFRLQSNSPCIDRGNIAYVTSSTDLDARPRIVGGTVDMGAYEFQDEFLTWLQQFSLPTNGTADFTDPDSDRFNNYQEYRCATVPTNALSFLRLLPPAPAGADVTLTWPSVTNRSYFLEWSTDLSASPAFLPLAANLPGQPGTTTFTHTNGVGLGPCFYRVAVP